MTHNHSLGEHVKLFLIETQQRPVFRWKFDPTVFEEPYDPHNPERWHRAWSGVEKIYGHWFQIDCESVSILHGPFANHVDFRVKVTPMGNHGDHYLKAYSIMIADGSDEDLEVSEDSLKQLRKIGDMLRKDVIDSFKDKEKNWGEELDDIERLRSRLPPWRWGQWTVPGLGKKIVGDRIDLGLFQFIIPKSQDCIYLIGRQNFVAAGSKPKAWSGAFHNKKSIENLIDKNVDFDNHDPQHLAGLFEDIIFLFRMKDVQQI